VIEDRRAAVGEAMRRAQAGDTVLLAGRATRRSIIVGERSDPWDEAERPRAALRELGFAA